MTNNDFKLECFVRSLLGQEELFDSELNIIRCDHFTSPEEPYFKPEHLRFDFDARDNWREPQISNNNIIKLLQLKVDICYLHSRKGGIEFHYIQFLPELTGSYDKRNKIDYEFDVLEYGGYGTIDICMDLIKRFGSYIYEL